MGLRMTEEEYKAFVQRRQANRGPLHGQALAEATGEEKPKRSKYGNSRVEVDGKKFDSLHEARFYEELMIRVRAGELKTVLRQVPFDLPGGIRYMADFVTIDLDNRVTVYDAKSEITKKNRTYINKRKQLKACCGLEIIEV